MKRADQLSYVDLAKYAEGEVTASEAEEMAERLSKEPRNRRKLARINRAIAHLRPDETLDDIDIYTGIHQRLAETSFRSESHRRAIPFRRIGLAAAAVTAILLPAILFLKGPPSPAENTAGFRAKSAKKHVDNRSRWIALNVFRLSGNEAAEQVASTLHAKDGLLFSYTNLGPKPFSRLMVFAVDHARRVYWYYPAYLDERDDPKGISIAKGVSRAGLREVIAHPYREGALTIFGLFSDGPLTVSAVEAAVRQGIADSEGFEATFDGVRVTALNVTVLR